MRKYLQSKNKKQLYSLPDFTGVVGAAFEQVINVVVVSLQCFMLGLGAHAEHRYIGHCLRQLRNGLALYDNTFLSLDNISKNIICLTLHPQGRHDLLNSVASGIEYHLKYKGTSLKFVSVNKPLLYPFKKYCYISICPAYIIIHNHSTVEYKTKQLFLDE